MYSDDLTLFPWPGECISGNKEALKHFNKAKNQVNCLQPPKGDLSSCLPGSRDPNDALLRGQVEGVGRLEQLEVVEGSAAGSERMKDFHLKQRENFFRRSHDTEKQKLHCLLLV